MQTRPIFLILGLISGLFLSYCTPPKKVPGKQRLPPPVNRPSDKTKQPMDTVKWTPNNSGKPPIGSNPKPNNDNAGGDFSDQQFRVAMMLPFLTNQMDAASTEIPEKSRLAVQFYGGASIALEKLSTEEGMNLVVDVYDSKTENADFDKLLANPKIDKADLYIGPIRSAHVTALANRTKMSRKPLISPESPNMDLTNANPNFIQINPSLKAHCEAIARYILKRNQPEQVVLICKQKESDRLAYFQKVNTGKSAFAELILPDATENFNSTDLKPYFKPGKTTVFVMPSWASQDFVFSFLRKVKSSMGKNKVEIYGMPQWKNFENIEPDYFQSLNVHISSAVYINLQNEEVKAFREKFYQMYGTIPDEDAYNGYDVTMFTGKMLRKYGKGFPEYLPKEKVYSLQGKYWFVPVFANGAGNDKFANCDYLENKFVHILKFDNYQFAPVE